MDDVARPNFKQHTNLQGRLFTSETARAARSLGAEKHRANASVKEALMNAFDKLGNEAFFVQLGRGSAEDKRCLAMILAKLLPIEVAGALDATLTVRVVSMMSEEAQVQFPTDATQRLLPPIPVGAAGLGRDPEDGRG